MTDFMKHVVKNFIGPLEYNFSSLGQSLVTISIVSILLKLKDNNNQNQ